MRGAVLPGPRVTVRAEQAPDLSLGWRTSRAGSGSQRGEAPEVRVGRVITRRYRCLIAGCASLLPPYTSLVLTQPSPVPRWITRSLACTSAAGRAGISLRRA